MFRPRFSLKMMFAAMTFAGLSLAFLTQPLMSWHPSFLFTSVLALLLLSLPACVYSRAEQRAFYVGFALVGWVYFLMAYSPWLETIVGRQLLAFPIAESICFSVTGSLGECMHYYKVCHALSMFVMAYTGGFVAQKCHSHQASPSKQPQNVNEEATNTSKLIQSSTTSL